MSEQLTSAQTSANTLTEHDVTVLLIDDQRIIGEAVRRMVADEKDIHFHYLGDPTAALETAREVQPTVILQDLVMPQVDGLTLVSEFRQHEGTRDIPMIVLSTKEEPKVKAEAFARGANDYIVKLPDRLELIARIRYHSQGYISMLQRNEALRKLEMRNRFIRETFGRYLSDDVVDNLLEDPEGLKLGGEKRKLTIMMSDLRGFTALSESQSAEKVVGMLNNYLGVMTEVIMKHGGTIDEFIGDGILVIFGAPDKKPDDARRAIACAVEMQMRMKEVNAWNVDNGLPEVEMGIGLNTGEVVVGNIGSQRRTKYGVVGSHVNLTGRIESYTVGGQILISPWTRDDADAELRIDGEMKIEPKGVKEPITIYEVSGIGGPYDLYVSHEEAEMIPLHEPLELLYSPLEGKHALGEHYPARIVGLSEKMAELVCDEPLDPMTNLKIRFAADGDEATDFYGKILARRARTEGARVLRFTSMPMDIRNRLSSLAEQARG